MPFKKYSVKVNYVCVTLRSLVAVPPINNMFVIVISS